MEVLGHDAIGDSDTVDGEEEGAVAPGCCILYEREDICSTREANFDMVICSNTSCLSTREEVADLTELVTD